jgi:hypothetical protein
LLNISDNNKELCFADSTLKPLMIYTYSWVDDPEYIDGGYWSKFNVIEDAIILESAEFDEGILDNTQFALGTFVIPKLKLQWANNGIRYSDMLCIPVQKLGEGDNAEYIAYFSGFLTTEELSQDGNIVRAEMSPTIASDINTNVLPLLKELTVSQYEGQQFLIADLIADVLWNTAGIQLSYIDNALEFSGRFYNANKYISSITDNDSISEITLGDFLRQTGEFLGAQILFKDKHKVTIQELENGGDATLGMSILEFVRISNTKDIINEIVAPLPEGYKAIPYLPISKDQYLDTGIVPNANTGAEYQFSPYSITEIGGRILSATNFDFPYLKKQIITSGGVYSTRLVANRLGNEKTDTYALSQREGTIATVKAFINSNTVNSNVAFSDFELTAGTLVTNDTLVLGNIGGNFGEENAFEGKIFYCKIYDGNTLIRDLYPCIMLRENTIPLPGMYDRVGETFYPCVTEMFAYQSPIESYNIPYYINLRYDKTKRLNFNYLELQTKNSDNASIDYKVTIKEPTTSAIKTYKIFNNLFFNKLADTEKEEALREISYYLSELDFYYCDLETVYASFLEPNDYLICTPEKFYGLPEEYAPLEYLNMQNDGYLTVHPPYILTGDILGIDIEFEIGINQETNDTNQSILDSDGLIIFVQNQRVALANRRYDDTITYLSDKVPIGQKLHLHLECDLNSYTVRYSGIKNGEEHLWANLYDLPQSERTWIGLKSYCSYYSLKFYKNGSLTNDYVFALRKSDGAVGYYDKVEQYFAKGSKTKNWQYENGNIVFPMLSSYARGIHSIRANITATSIGV